MTSQEIISILAVNCLLVCIYVYVYVCMRVSGPLELKLDGCETLARN